MCSLTIKNMKEFNFNANIYFQCKSEQMENLLNRNLSHISASKNFLPNTETNEACIFYVNLHRLISVIQDANSSTFWLCIAILNQTITLSAKNDDLHKFRFLPVLIKKLKHISNVDKQTEILTLIQNLTYGLSVSFEENYLVELVEFLVNNVMNVEEKINNSISLSILINISRNKEGAKMLVHCLENVRSFADKIKPFGILGQKLIIILGDEISLLNEEDLAIFLQLAFSELNTAIRTWDVLLLSNAIDFISDMKSNNVLTVILMEKQNLKKNVEILLQNVTARLEVDDSIEDNLKENQSICISLIFKFLNIILDLDPALAGSYSALVDLGLNWINNDKANVNIITLLINISNKIIHHAKIDDNVEIFKKIENILPSLISNSEKNTFPQDETIALLKLLGILVNNTNLRLTILNNATETFFKQILSRVLNTNFEINFTEFTSKDIEMFIICINTMVEFSNAVPAVWFGIVFNLFKLKQIHFILARGMLMGNEEVCSTIFKLVKIHDCHEEISKILAKQGSSFTNALQNSQTSYNNPEIHQMSKTQENHLSTLITKITKTLDNGDFKHVLTTDLMEIYNNKINMCHNTEKLMKYKLDNATMEITHLHHKLEILSTELMAFRNMIFSLNLNQERLQIEKVSLQQEKENINMLLLRSNKLLDKETKNSVEFKQTLETKEKKIEILTKELERLLSAEQTLLKEVHEKESKIISTTNLMRKVEEKNIKQIDVQEKKLKEMLTELNEIKAKNMKSESFIHLLQTEVTEKASKIEMLEIEVEDLEKTRQQILSLMQCKTTTKRK